MKPDPKILDDLARVAGSAVNIVSGLQQQIGEDLKSRVDHMATKLDLVPREDLERAEARIDALGDKLDALEERLAALEGGPAPKKKTRKAA